MAFATYPSLADKAVLITGGASGIGADLVVHFRAQGARVAFLDIDVDAAGQMAQANVGSGSAIYRLCDLRDVDATLSAIDALSAELGPFSILLNNAGDDARHDVLAVTPDYWDRQMSVNLRQQFFVAQHVVKALPPDAPASIINMGSIAWVKGARDVIVYATAKSAVVGMTKVMSREFGRRGVRVNAIAPGWVGTDKQLEQAESRTPGAFEEAVKSQAIPRMLEAADVSRLALWLAADDSAMCTGQTIIVDGGLV